MDVKLVCLKTVRSRQGKKNVTFLLYYFPYIPLCSKAAFCTKINLIQSLQWWRQSYVKKPSQSYCLTQELSSSWNLVLDKPIEMVSGFYLAWAFTAYIILFPLALSSTIEYDFQNCVSLYLKQTSKPNKKVWGNICAICNNVIGRVHVF